ncbi:hypothetical protein [Oculatella sp. LEGE 06141]|uniref:hypothetical protein n=1 Tax=Oculatella sp. LEGE 06141 TaxID=1828648 RepID=UPI00187FF7EC|nr:hypothetical protein [Oculatella sp. LEGE 06141]
MSQTYRPENSDRSNKTASLYRQPTAVAVTATRRLVSNRDMDLLLLAFCSCLLTVICHPAANLLHSPSSAATSVAAPSTSSPFSQIDFMIKSGLLTASQQEEKLEE